jgi:hypothetical protein
MFRCGDGAKSTDFHMLFVSAAIRVARRSPIALSKPIAASIPITPPGRRNGGIPISRILHTQIPMASDPSLATGTAAPADSSPVITASAGGGPISVNVTDHTHPQSVSGVIWRFDAPDQAGTGVDQFRTKKPTAQLGSPAAVDGKKFVVEGRVIAFGDSPPSPFEVTVTVLQDGLALHTEVPANGGKGSVGDQDRPFEYAFRMRVQ